MRFGAPQDRRLKVGRWGRHALGDGGEEAGAGAVRRPAAQADRPAGTADADELARGGGVVGREHVAEGGGDDVEAVVGEWQGGGVPHDPLDLNVRRGGVPARRGQPLLGEVAAGDTCATQCGRDRDRATVAGGDVE